MRGSTFSLKEWQRLLQQRLLPVAIGAGTDKIHARQLQFAAQTDDQPPDLFRSLRGFQIDEESLQQLGHVVASSSTARAFAIERPPQQPPAKLSSRSHGDAEPCEAAFGDTVSDSAVYEAEAEVLTQPCGLHKAYNYLDVSTLESILTRVEKEYAYMEEEVRAITLS